jgi:NADH:ubiquinone oxidoreductase subunit 6 (subunit J)
LESELIALLISGALFATVAGALLSSKVSNSLIALFYTSIVLGVAFTVYGDALLGLLTMITFAGAISVLLLSVVLITGESKLSLGARTTALLAIPLAAAVGGASLLAIFSGQAGGIASSDTSLAVLSFLWTERPWDLLILMVAFGGAMITIISLLGGDQ